MALSIFSRGDRCDDRCKQEIVARWRLHSGRSTRGCGRRVAWAARGLGGWICSGGGADSRPRAGMVGRHESSSTDTFGQLAAPLVWWDRWEDSITKGHWQHQGLGSDSWWLPPWDGRLRSEILEAYKVWHYRILEGGRPLRNSATYRPLSSFGSLLVISFWFWRLLNWVSGYLLGEDWDSSTTRCKSVLGSASLLF